MSNSYGKVFSPYEDLPSDVEPSSGEHAMNDDEFYLGEEKTPVFDNTKEIMGEEVGTDIDDITDIDNNDIEFTAVQQHLSDKLNLVINSHRLIIDRMDTFLENQKMIMSRLEQVIDADNDE